VNLFVNDLEIAVPDTCTVLDLLKMLEEPISHVLVEVNSTFVYADGYGSHYLNPGDHVEVIHPAFGG